MTAQELIKKLQNRSSGSYFRDEQLLEEYVKQRISVRLKARMELIEELYNTIRDPKSNTLAKQSAEKRLKELFHDFST